MLSWWDIVVTLEKAADRAARLIGRMSAREGLRLELASELRTMDADVDRLQRAGNYAGFTAFTMSTWQEARRQPIVIQKVHKALADAYEAADAVAHEVAARRAQPRPLAGQPPDEMAVIPSDGLDELRAKIAAALDALQRPRRRMLSH